MAMLAEPRRKQKWTLNPRGKQWSDDSNKFGQKMLEKMGWTSGKGLGANEQGMTEHVRVKFKDDQGGIGFSKSNQDKLWTEHQEGFNMLLQSLRADEESTPETQPMEKEKDLTGKSLELKSKQSRARVHYQKFTRGKDVNKYSTKDLANIFGKRNLNEKTKVETETPESAENQLDNCTEPTDVNGLSTIVRGTMDEYFKQKMPKTLMSKKNSENDGAAESESDGERYVGFGFSQSNTKTPTTVLASNDYSFINPALDLNDSDETIRKRKNEIDPEYLSTSKDDTLDSDKTPKKKRKSSKNYAFENPALDLACPEALGSSKKIKKEFIVSTISTNAVECIEQHDEDYEVKGEIVGVTSSQTDINGHENDALDITDEANGKKRVTFNDTIEYNTDSLDTNKKKHKKKRNKSSSSNKLDPFEVALDESAKKKLKNISLTPEKNSFVNEALDVEVINVESIENEANERKSNKRKRKKNRPTLNLDTIKEEDDVIEIDIEPDVLNSDECPISKKKKLNDKNGVDSTPVQETDANYCVEVPTSLGNEKSKKSKNKKKMKKTESNLETKKENTVTDESENSKENEDVGNAVDVQDVFQVKIKDKKKKKKNKECEVVDSSVIKADGTALNNSSCVDNQAVNDIEVEKHKISKPKKYFKTLFNQRPIANFTGSNINDLKGYGVDL